MTNDELRHNIESLHSNLAQLFEQSQKHYAQIAQIVVAQGRNDQQIAQLTSLLAQDGENIRALAGIAEPHQNRLDRIDPQT